MGNVSSVPTDPSCSLFLRRPDRFAVKQMDVLAARAYSSSAYSSPSSLEINLSNLNLAASDGAGIHHLLTVDESLNVSMIDGNPAEYIKDTDSNGFPFILKVPHSDQLKFKFKLQLHISSTLPINNLTCITARTRKQLDNFITTEFFHNANIQNEKNVNFVGDYTSADETPKTLDLDFTLDWRQEDEIARDETKGTHLVVCFAEYDKRDHTLQQLARFTIYIDQAPIAPAETPTTTTTTTTTNHNTASNEFINRIIPSPSPPPLAPISYQHGLSSASTVPIPVPLPPGASVAAATTQQQQRPSSLANALNGFQSPSSPQRSTSALLPSSPVLAQHHDHQLEESIDVVLQREKKQGLVMPRPDGDSTSQPEDGPLFRATIASLEKKTGNLKFKTKKLLKRAMLVHERQQSLVEAHRLFIQELKDIGETEIPAFQSVIYKYFDKNSQGQMEMVAFLRESAHEMLVHVVDPLRKLYDLEIKSFDVRKREFDDESSQYYSWLSRYLSMKQEAKGKKKIENDTKYPEKKKAFELCRFDYYSYMQDLHGGRKQQDVVYQLAKYAESEMNRLIKLADGMKQNVKPHVDTLIEDVKDANKDWTRNRTEREVRRRALERSIVAPELSSPMQEHPHYVHDPNANISSSPPSSNNTNNNPPTLRVNTDHPNSHSIASALATPDLATATAITGNTIFEDSLQTPSVQDDFKKEGLLWAMSRPAGLADPLANLNKPGWHKFWVVLANGKICEYTNWKQGVVDLHNDPINLKVACVREARNADRRFCFEVVTPQYKRVYQATNEEDMQAWIRAINNGITSSLEAFEEPTIPPPSSSAVQRRSSNRRTASLHHSASHHHHGSNHAQPQAVLPTHPPPTPQADDALLQTIRSLSPSNARCADCGSAEKCEWLSINLLVVLCIDCSGIHRSLGSHISKVRSLTLDTVSFTKDLVELIKSVNNDMMNSIWEQLLENKPRITAENRPGFITEKYVEKKFVEPVARPNAQLRGSVIQSDLRAALHALASRANPNTPSSEDGDESLLIYTLKNAPEGATTFPFAELLLLNSASLPSPSAGPIALTNPEARAYLSRKLAKDAINSTGATNSTPLKKSQSVSKTPDKVVGRRDKRMSYQKDQ